MDKRFKALEWYKQECADEEPRSSSWDVYFQQRKTELHGWSQGHISSGSDLSRSEDPLRKPCRSLEH